MCFFFLKKSLTSLVTNFGSASALRYIIHFRLKRSYGWLWNLLRKLLGKLVVGRFKGMAQFLIMFFSQILTSSHDIGKSLNFCWDKGQTRVLSLWVLSRSLLKVKSKLFNSSLVWYVITVLVKVAFSTVI